MNITEMEMALRNIADALDRAVTARDGHARSETLRLLAEAIDEAEAGLCNAPLVVQSVAPSQPPMRKVLVKTMS